MNPKKLTAMQREILTELCKQPRPFLWLASRSATKRRLIGLGLISHPTPVSDLAITDAGREALAHTEDE
jgi:hypothetical protein